MKEKTEYGGNWTVILATVIVWALYMMFALATFTDSPLKMKGFPADGYSLSWMFNYPMSILGCAIVSLLFKINFLKELRKDRIESTESAKEAYWFGASAFRNGLIAYILIITIVYFLFYWLRIGLIYGVCWLIGDSSDRNMQSIAAGLITCEFIGSIKIAISYYAKMDIYRHFAYKRSCEDDDGKGEELY